MKKRLTTTEAAEVLGVTPDILRGYRRIGWLSGSTASGGTGRGKRIYFHSDEIDAFARGGAPAAKAYRESIEAGPAKPRRYRKAGA